mmetsp:Transcript_26754/g.56892  ORF Transcript_26754/g.56892 Transcript_26754/m.56892 type:complete len:200 (+) Transcript_26754:28-627(+)
MEARDGGAAAGAPGEAGAPPEGDPTAPVRVASAAELSRHGAKVQATVHGRYVTVFNVGGALRCLDAVCYHAGGPLTVGDIEEVDGRACVRCPWHNYIVTVETGEKLYQALVKTDDGKLVPGGWESVGVRQRCHRAYEEGGEVFVALDASEGKLESDKYAKDPACGKRLMQGGKSAMGNRLFRRGGAPMVGADGTWRKRF